jgi:hypothetical protein
MRPNYGGSWFPANVPRPAFRRPVRRRRRFSILFSSYYEITHKDGICKLFFRASPGLAEPPRKRVENPPWPSWPAAARITQSRQAPARRAAAKAMRVFLRALGASARDRTHLSIGGGGNIIFWWWFHALNLNLNLNHNHNPILMTGGMKRIRIRIRNGQPKK